MTACHTEADVYKDEVFMSARVAGLKDLHIHDLRYVFASKMVMNDISARTVIKANGFYSGGNVAFISLASYWDTGHIFFRMF